MAHTEGTAKSCPCGCGTVGACACAPTLTQSGHINYVKVDAQKPYVCPVCNGRGSVNAGFSGTVVSGDEKCRSCFNGIIWGPA